MMTKKLANIFIIGVAILAVAIMLNILAQILSISTWYDYFENPGETSLVSYIWLFFVYPFLLGLAAYIANKWLS